MSVLDVLNKPISLSPKKTAERATTTPARGSSETAYPALGGAPRANLLPASVLVARRARRIVRGVIVALILAILAVLTVSGLAVGRAAVASAQLAEAQARTTEILQAQQQLGEVSAAQASIEQLSAALAVVGATDVDWAAYISSIRGTLGDELALNGVAVTPVGAAPTGAAAETAPAPDAAAAPASAVASIVLTATGKDLGTFEGWLERLTTLPGYVDASLDSVGQTESGYLGTVTLSVDSTIYSGLYTQAEEQ